MGSTLLRGISGGERKRTSIGVELLTNPSLIFMDEPTTGLDSATAFNVLEIMKSLAKNGRTVISTIHQPSSEIFDMFDKLLLLVQGELIYQVDLNKNIFFGRANTKYCIFFKKNIRVYCFHISCFCIKYDFHYQYFDYFPT